MAPSLGTFTKSGVSVVQRTKSLLLAVGRAMTSRRSTRNVVWNLLGGLSLGAMTVLATPVFVSRLGLEGYGVVGLWLVMQVMVGLLDMGLGATVVRSIAASPPGDAGASYRGNLVRTLESLYWGIALALGVAFVFAAPVIGGHWLKTVTLSPITVTHALRLMGITLALQFVSVLYSNGLAGLQAQGLMNALQAGINVLRYGGGVAVLLWRADLTWFFGIQAGVALVQSLALREAVWRKLDSPEAGRAVVSVQLVRQLWRYSVGMGFSSVAAVLLANSDRFVVGTMLPAAELGKYSIAFTATGLLQLGIQPFYRAYFPRYAELMAAGHNDQVKSEYFSSCQLVAALLIPLIIGGWVFAPELLTDWLGRGEPTVVTIFRCLLVGVGFSGLGWLPAALQQASGWTRLHAFMMAGSLVVGVPLMIFGVRTFGTAGATAAWLIHGGSGMTLELWLMHRRLFRGEMARWYRSVIVTPVLVTLPIVGTCWWLMPDGFGRFASVAYIGAATAAAVGATLAYEFTRRRGLRPATLDPVSD